MADTLGQSVVIKYQLPDEDLDALVSVSCPDDLENMMDEYEKLLERSSDGSAKMRILLFSPSELENASFEDLEDGGNRYVEAVNGIMDGFNRLARKESIESGNSARSSDLSGTEGADSLGQVSGGFSPKGISVVQLETAPKVVNVDPSTMPYAAPTTVGVVSEQDLGLPSASFPVSSPYTHTQAIQENPNHANYVQLPSQMGFPSHILGHVQPIYAQQPIHMGVGVSPHQFSPASHMTPNPSFISTSNAVAEDVAASVLGSSVDVQTANVVTQQTDDFGVRDSSKNILFFFLPQGFSIYEAYLFYLHSGIQDQIVGENKFRAVNLIN
ncbi:hypothetical protein ABFS82_11G086000 [Erythranthe guttata]|nr:PREDICTED: uncharacterized protein LOC105973410 [Erythranthe guttata]|eukprot:XP_012853885.1 PREDICTED: uncharacterized protein LOC105973410 [Erythranthe guttata]